MVFRDFSSSGVETTGKKKRLKRCNLHCFLLVPRTKQCYLRCFLTLAAPKSSQNIGIYDVFTTTRKANVAKTPLFATLWQHNISYQEQNNTIYDVFSPSQPQNRAKTLVFTMFLQQPEKQM